MEKILIIKAKDKKGHTHVHQWKTHEDFSQKDVNKYYKKGQVFMPPTSLGYRQYGGKMGKIVSAHIKKEKTPKRVAMGYGNMFSNSAYDI